MFTKIKAPVLDVISSEKFWDHVKKVTQALMPALFLLRLADRNIPAMDQLYYYVRKMDTTINTMKAAIESIENNFIDHGDNNFTMNYRAIARYYLMDSRNQQSISTIASRITSLGQSDKDVENDSDSDSDSEGEGEIVDDLADEDDDVPDAVLEPTQGENVKISWEKRSKLLRHDIAIVAWVCSPLPAVMKDVVDTSIQAVHIDAVNRVLRKWIISEKEKEDDDIVQHIINTFWDECLKFHTKTDMFADMDSSFHENHIDFKSGKSYLWHCKDSATRTEVFGKVAVKVCSKILGIGSAERSWGDVKHLKSNKGSHLSSQKVKKQSTLYGQSCMEIARSKMQDTSNPLHCWFDDNLEEVIHLFEETPVNVNIRPVKVFRAWIEPLDNETRLLHDDGARDG